MVKVSRILLIIIWFFVVCSFVTTQLTNDFMPFWAYGRYVNNSGETGIAALLEAWELKGLLFRSYLYIEYALTSLFSTSFDSNGQLIYKIIGIIPLLAVLSLSVFIFPSKYLSNFKKEDIFFVYSILLLTVHFASHFQAEMWGVAILLLSFSLYMHEDWRSKMMAAFLYCLTFYLKSPIPLLGGSLVLAAAIIKKQNFKTMFADVLPFACMSALFLLSSLAFLYYNYPQEIIDIWDASYFQHTLFHESKMFVSSFINLIILGERSLFYNPVIAVGILALIIILWKWIKRKLWYNILFLIFVWVFPLLYILISNCFFVYHYYLLAFSSLLSILIMINNVVIKKNVVYVVSILFITYYVLALSSICTTNVQAKEIYGYYMDKIKEKDDIYVGCKMGEGKIMFLDDGMGAFLFANPSYLRYFYPLPLQRAAKKDPLIEKPIYKSVKQQALSFDGDYITLNKNWFLSNDKNEDIITKIRNEYKLYKQITFSYYSWDLFHIEPATSTLLIYKRKKY